MGKNEVSEKKKKSVGAKVSKTFVVIGLLTVLTVLFTQVAFAEPSDIINSLLGSDSQALRIVIQLTLIALLPTLLIMLTGFTRIVIVLSMVRNAIGLQNMPPNIVIIGLSLFLTYFVMAPVLTQVSDTALQPYLDNQMQYTEFADKAMVPFRDFMFKQTYKSDLTYFCSLADVDVDTEAAGEAAANGNAGDSEAILDKIPNRVIISAFMTSELKHAFAIGLFLYIPFVVIDMVVASTLMAMGMMMLPPATISMPFKIMLFVLVDGWQLTIGTLVNSFGT